MAFQIRDETAGINIIYIENNGDMGLGSLPIGGQQITVQGVGYISETGVYAPGVFVPGVQLENTGSISIPPEGDANVAISASQQPVVSGGVQPRSVTNSNITFYNPTGSTITISYSIW